MKKILNFKLTKLLILFFLFPTLNQCGMGADARQYPPEPHKRVQKNLEEGRGFRLMGGDKKKGGGDFEARRTENVSTSHYFIRATNREFNFSNNPSFVTGSDNSFVESSFEKDPKTFITTIGLYSDSNEMLAVDKTSQPIAKSFDKEVLIKVKLDF